MLLQRQSRTAIAVAPVFMASIGTLQPGIDPVFLTLLSDAHEIMPARYGWIVGATQSGMAVGSVAVWKLGERLPAAALPLAATIALLTAIATFNLGDLGVLLVLRAIYGLAMGIIYSHAMSLAAVNRPNGAYGAVFLLQLILSSVVVMALAAVADRFGPHIALATMCLAPLAVLALVARQSRASRLAPAIDVYPAKQQDQAVDITSWSLAAATLLFVCATMMVWTFTGALAAASNISELAVSQAVAIGSIAGALAALAVMSERPLVPPALSGVMAGMTLLSPVLAAQTGNSAIFIGAIVLLNIGSTAIIIRCSGLATASSTAAKFRRLVTCTHSLGLIVGPVIGSIVVEQFGLDSLTVAVLVATTAGCLALLVPGLSKRWHRLAGPDINFVS